MTTMALNASTAVPDRRELTRILARHASADAASAACTSCDFRNCFRHIIEFLKSGKEVSCALESRSDTSVHVHPGECTYRQLKGGLERHRVLSFLLNVVVSVRGALMKIELSRNAPRFAHYFARDVDNGVDNGIGLGFVCWH